MALAFAGPAAANVPKFSVGPGSIVPGVSIGGVAVGMTMNKAKVTWGAPDECSTYRGLTSCQYTSPRKDGLRDFFATFYVMRGKVVSMDVRRTHRMRT